VRLLLSITLLICVAFGQNSKSENPHARDFYTELKEVNGLNPLVTTVCFRPDSPDAFDVLGFSQDFNATAKAKGIPLPEQTRKEFRTTENFLFLQTYINGVKTAESLLLHDKDDSNTWYDEGQTDKHTWRLKVSISPSGRIRRAVYMDKEFLPKAEQFGKCELIK